MFIISPEQCCFKNRSRWRSPGTPPSMFSWIFYENVKHITKFIVYVERIMSVKAFELIPAIERVKLLGEKAKTEIRCIECCGKNIYVGTNDCFVVHYTLEEKIQPNGRTAFNCKKEAHKYLAVKKPIVQLKAANALRRLLVVCDNTLSPLNMIDLEPAAGNIKVKGVVSFCLNENPTSNNPFSIEICVGLKKKALQVFTVTEDRMILIKELSTPETPLTMAFDGKFICVAMTSQCMILNYETNHMQDLFPHECQHTMPLVKRINKEEFLLSGPSALGMFVTSEGVSQRPPLQWSENLVSVSYTHPYILALNDEFITVHSILDQQQKQALPFQGGILLGDFDGKLFVCSSREIYALVPIAIEKQIQSLLADKRVSEALQLAQNARQPGITKEKSQQAFQRIQQQAGFIEFSQRQLEKARGLFKEGSVDVRELINVYPHLLPTVSNFTRSVPLLHDIADINQLSRGDQSCVQEFKDFLVSYLEDIRQDRSSADHRVEIDTALLKLYAEMSLPQLVTLISSHDNQSDPHDAVTWLNKYHHYHCQAIMYKAQGHYEQALQVWQRIVDGQVEDRLFPGLDLVVDILSNLNDHSLVWKYADWALQKDEELAVKIFTCRPAEEAVSERMRTDTIVDYLHRFPKAVVAYLEYLVLEKKLEKEKYHTHLAVLYLDQVLKLKADDKSNTEQFTQARSKLQSMLQSSNLYRVQLILGKVKETEFYEECAILHGKLEEHDKAIRMLVYKLKNYPAAEEYCLVNSQGKGDMYRKTLFQTLLSVYLDPNYERRDQLVDPAVSLLNSNKSDFDTVKVLQLIPENWSVTLLSAFLQSSIRKSLNNTRTTRVERMLARGENLITKKSMIDIQRQVTVVSEDKLCAVCKRSFSDSTFVRYPNGKVTHIHCAKNRYVCPVTGRIFNTKKQSS